jgi:hypothetical protein
VVSKRPHNIAGEKVQVQLHELSSPQLVYPNMLLFHNLPDDLTESHLKTHLELITRSVPLKMRFTDDDGAVVTFDRPQSMYDLFACLCNACL